MELKGTLYSKQEKKQVSDNFSKIEFILKVDGQYPQYLTCQVANAKCDLLNGVNVGDELNLSINLNGRLLTNKEGVEVSFNTLDVYKIN